MTRHLNIKDAGLPNKLAGEEGFEPSLTGPEPAVLPLDYSPVTPQNRTGIGQKIQSLLSRSKVKLATRLRILLPIPTTPGPPWGSAGTGRQAWLRTTCRKASGFESPLPHYLESLCYESLPGFLLKSPPAQVWPPLFLPCFSTAKALYRLETALSGPSSDEVRLVLSRPVAAGGAGEPSPGMAPPLLPQYVVEVVP